MGEVLNWDDESAAYIRTRGERYPGGSGIELEWAQQVMDDFDWWLSSRTPSPGWEPRAPSVSRRTPTASWS